MLSQDTALALPLLEKIRLVLFTPLYVGFGVAALASSPLLALISKSSKTAKKIIFYLCLRTIIPSLRYFLDTVPTWLVLTWWLRSRNIAQDGVRVMKDVALGEPCCYGVHPRENVQCLHPCGVSNRRQAERAVLYIHGGGHIVSFFPLQIPIVKTDVLKNPHIKAANSILLMPSVTPWVRAGYSVYCMNYPLSPASVFPDGVISVLRCLKYLRKQDGITRICITGDSAGGNLATAAAAFVCNPPLLAKLAREDNEFTQDQFPELNGAVSMYGLLDRTSAFKHNTEGISGFETSLSRFALDLLFYAYTGDADFADSLPRHGKLLDGRCTLVDFIELMDRYPKTFLVVGKCDVLVHSSRAAHKLLTEKGFDSQLEEYNARHAFIGLPPALNIGGTWQYHSKPATEKIIAFFESLAWE